MNGFFTSNAGARIARNLVALACWSQHLCGYGQTRDTALPPVQEPVYHSVFAGYQVMSELKLTPWPAANDTVREVGGWRAYAKEAAATNAAAAAATPAPQPSTSPTGAPKP